MRVIDGEQDGRLTGEVREQGHHRVADKEAIDGHGARSRSEHRADNVPLRLAKAIEPGAEDRPEELMQGCERERRL